MIVYRVLHPKETCLIQKYFLWLMAKNLDVQVLKPIMLKQRINNPINKRLFVPATRLPELIAVATKCVHVTLFAPVNLYAVASRCALVLDIRLAEALVVVPDLIAAAIKYVLVCLCTEKGEGINENIYWKA